MARGEFSSPRGGSPWIREVFSWPRWSLSSAHAVPPRPTEDSPRPPGLRLPSNPQPSDSHHKSSGSRCPKDFCSRITLTCIRITLPGPGKPHFDATRAGPTAGQSFVAEDESQSDADRPFFDANDRQLATNKLLPAQGRVFPIPGKGFPGQGKACPIPGKACFVANRGCFAATSAESTAGAGSRRILLARPFPAS
jgi:hypothetical protein